MKTEQYKNKNKNSNTIVFFYITVLQNQPVQNVQN